MIKNIFLSLLAFSASAELNCYESIDPRLTRDFQELFAKELE